MQKRYSKKERSKYWNSMKGIRKRKRFTRWPGVTQPPVVTSGSTSTSSLSSFSLVSHLYETFVPDNIFSDLLLQTDMATLPSLDLKVDSQLLSHIPVLIRQSNYAIWLMKIRNTLSTYGV